MSVKAVIFDMDGVLIDSEMEYIRIWKDLYDQEKIDIKIEDLYFLAGSPHHVEIDLFSNKAGISVEKAEEKRTAFFKQHPVDYLSIRKAYVEEILKHLKEKGITIALASSSTFSNIKTVLSQCAIKDYFSLIVSGELFEKTKPDPEIYLTTIAKLGFEKEEIIVIEDSNYGIEAAKRAGLKVIAIEDPVLRFDNRKADWIAKDLKEAERIIELC